MCNTRSKTRDKVAFNHPTHLENRKQLLITSAITNVLLAVKRLDNFQVKQGPADHSSSASLRLTRIYYDHMTT